MPQSPPRPSDLELQILGCIWRTGPATARQVLGSMPDGKERAYTSILSVMQVMEKKGLLEVGERRGLANVYRPAVSRRQVLGPLMRGMVKKVFGGSPSAAVQQLLTENRVDRKELAEIRRLLDELEERAEPEKKEEPR